jgi:hypothetical protein
VTSHLQFTLRATFPHRPLTRPCAGVHLTLSYRDIADDDLKTLSSVLKGDTSSIFALHMSHPAISSPGAASADSSHEDEEWGFKNRVLCSPSLASIDLSGNRITDAGVKFIADCVTFSTVRFIALKFNPCRAMPLLTSDGSWLEMMRKVQACSKPRCGLHLHSEQADCSPPHAMCLPIAFVARQKAPALQYAAVVTSFGSSNSNHNSHAHDSDHEQAAKRRFRGSAVHPL